jgi:hypothetical protein
MKSSGSIASGVVAQQPFCSWGPWGLLVLCVWIAILTIISVRVLVQPRWNSVYPIFADAGRHWRAGTELYRIPNNPYRYSPLVTVGFVPWSLLPDPVAGALWRLVNAAVYLGALAWWCRVILPRKLTAAEWAFLYLLVVPLSVGSLNNGQSNALVLGLLLAGLAAATQRSWTLAGLCIALASLFKIYPLAIGLLLAAVYGWKFASRLGLALVLGLALPFCFQAPGYVWSQYAGWLGHLSTEDRQATSIEFWYRDLRLLCEVCHLPLSSFGYRAIQLLFGLGMTAFCVFAGRRRQLTECDSLASRTAERHVLVLLLALGCCWMTALGVAAESCTYIMLAPSLAWSLLDTFANREPLRWKALLLVSCIVLLLAQLAVWIPGGVGRRIHSYGLQPAAALIFLLYIVLTTLRDLRQCEVCPTGSAPSSLPHAA